MASPALPHGDADPPRATVTVRAPRDVGSPRPARPAAPGRESRGPGADRPRRGWSLSGRLVAATVLLLSVGLALSGATVIAVLRSQLIAQVDDNLYDTVETLAQQDLDAIRSLGDQIVPTRYVVTIRVEDEPVHTVAHPRTSDGIGLPVLPADPGSQPRTVPGSETGVSWRTLSLPIVTVSGTRIGDLTISTPLDDVSATIRQTGKYVVLISTSLVVLLMTFAYLSIRHELRDLRAIERTAGAIAAGDLTRRVDPGPPGTEIGSLSSSLNTMLEQIERAFAARSASERRMRRFVADASHELRTPLATVRGYAELHRMGGVPEAEVPAAMSRIEAEATRMGTLVEDLLALARIDEARRLTLTTVDMADLARDAVRDLRALDPARDARYLPLPDHDGPTTLLGDADQLRQVLANLVGNTVRHTPTGTDVEILVGFRPGAPRDDDAARGPGLGSAAEPAADHVVIHVRDHGPGIPPEEAGKVFTRFYRVDRSRARSGGGGSGLGLAIVASVVAAHGGRARVLATPGGGTTVELRLPVDGPTEGLKEGDRISSVGV